MPRALSLIIPEGLVVIAAVALARFGTGIGGYAEVAEWLPTLVFLTGALLAWRFRRGRLFVGLAGLAPIWIWIILDPVEGWRLPLALASALVLGDIGASRERGLRGNYMLGLTVALVGLAIYAVGAGSWPEWHPGWVASLFSWSALPPLGALALSTVILGLLVVALLRPDGVAQGALWATIAVWGTLVIGDRAGALVLIAGAGGALVAGTLESIFSAAYRDALTALPSRRALDEKISALPAGTVVAMVDVDHFKQFNDTYGHDTGDQVLRMVAWRLAEVPDAEAFRYGGEEFTLIFDGLSLKDALARLEGARVAVAGNRFMLRSGDRPKGKKGKEKRGGDSARHGLSVTISIGAAVRGNGEHSAALLKRADEALYKAKEAGRDRVIAAK